jgi:UDPglucose 6-dehydrogenase
VKAIIHMARQSNLEPKVLQAVEDRNQVQKHVLFEKVTQRFGQKLDGHTFGIWGLSFKPGTDDMREAPSEVLVEALLAAGAKVRAYDPVAMPVARREWPKAWFDGARLTLVEHQYDVLDGCDALILVTEWKPFRHPDFEQIKKRLKRAVIFDGRNQYDPQQLRQLGFEFKGIGR